MINIKRWSYRLINTDKMKIKSTWCVIFKKHKQDSFLLKSQDRVCQYFSTIVATPWSATPWSGSNRRLNQKEYTKLACRESLYYTKRNPKFVPKHCMWKHTRNSPSQDQKATHQKAKMHLAFGEDRRKRENNSGYITFTKKKLCRSTTPLRKESLKKILESAR
jgi:hypothetical protein